MRFWLLLFTYLCISSLTAQGGWNWAQLSSMPEPVSSNALSEAILSNQKYVYSFGGIGVDLNTSSVHRKTFKYDVSNDQWEELTNLPDTLGKTGAAASFVRNRIYVIGGAGFDADGNEIISDKVHVFNPFIDTFEVNGANIPIPSTDHVQAVWRDSLIFVVAGWSNGGNIPAVQIYNPYFDLWTVAENIPDNTFYTAQGSSGYILGDTIFYFGGATGEPIISARNHLRKGIINASDPTQIQWSFSVDNDISPLFKSVASGHDKTVFWYGGSEYAHEFDGELFDGSGLAKPAARLLEFNSRSNTSLDIKSMEIGMMDMRGIAKLGGGNWIIAGGIDSLGNVSDRVYLMNNPKLSFISQLTMPPFFEVTRDGEHFKIETENVGKVFVFNTTGQQLFRANKKLADLYIPSKELHGHFLIFVYDDGSNVPVSRKLIKVD